MRQIKTEDLDSSTHQSPRRRTDSKQAREKRLHTVCYHRDASGTSGCACRPIRMTKPARTPPKAGEEGGPAPLPLPVGGASEVEYRALNSKA